MKSAEKKSHLRTVKIIVLGNSQVGKTSLTLRYTDDTFTDAYSTTLGIVLSGP